MRSKTGLHHMKGLDLARALESRMFSLVKDRKRATEMVVRLSSLNTSERKGQTHIMNEKKDKLRQHQRDSYLRRGAVR